MKCEWAPYELVCSYQLRLYDFNDVSRSWWNWNLINVTWNFVLNSRKSFRKVSLSRRSYENKFYNFAHKLKTLWQNFQALRFIKDAQLASALFQYVTEKMGGAEGTKLDLDFMEMERVRKSFQNFYWASVSVWFALNNIFRSRFSLPPRRLFSENRRNSRVSWRVAGKNKRIPSTKSYSSRKDDRR